ncbi:MAG TPA: hypothetical protein P5509_08365 [Bacteroidales bacterium]|nr:hypothetical protein [Bacteroidales bacterium]
MKVSSKYIIITILSLLLFACKTPQRICSEDASKAVLKNYAGLDACSWIIVLENGQKLEPLNLKEFDIELKDGQKIFVTYKVEPEYQSICMMGPIVRILCIEKRK